MPYQQGHDYGQYGAYQQPYQAPQAQMGQMYQLHGNINQSQQQHQPMVVIPRNQEPQHYQRDPNIHHCYQQTPSPQIQYHGLPSQASQPTYQQPQPFELSHWQQMQQSQRQQSMADVLREQSQSQSQYYTPQSQPPQRRVSYQDSTQQGYQGSTRAPHQQLHAQQYDQRPPQMHQERPRNQALAPHVSVPPRQPSQSAASYTPQRFGQPAQQIANKPSVQAAPSQTIISRPSPKSSEQSHVQQSARPLLPPLSQNSPLEPGPSLVQRHSGPLIQQSGNRQAPRPNAKSASAKATPQKQRQAAFVQIPMQRPEAMSDLMAAQMDGGSSPKRRRSNDGLAVPVCNAPMPPPSSAPKRPIQQPPSSSPLSSLPASQIPSTPPLPAVDNQALLLALADEYITAAHSMSTSLVADGLEEDFEQYHSLISTAMGCLESVLNNYRQPDARKEARIRLRLANLLHEETENAMEAEEILSKGSALCERSRLDDAKYAMHHLLVRLMFKSSPKAALKACEKLVEEVQKLNLVAWVYCFRFLRVSLSLQANNAQDTPAVLRHLTAITLLADRNYHVGVQIVAATFEALVHLRSSPTDAVELAQRSLAAARTHQLSSEMDALPQVKALLDVLDLACNLQLWNPEQASQRLQQMHNNLDALTRESGWSKRGVFTLQLELGASSDLEADTGGIMTRTENSAAALQFNWLNRGDLYALGFLLSGYASMSKNSENEKAERFLAEGLKLCNQPSEPLSTSLTTEIDRQTSRGDMARQIEVLSIWAMCGRSAWREAVDAAGKLNQALDQQGRTVDEMLRALISYLSAMAQQGLGEQEKALEHFGAAELTYQDASKTHGPLKDIRTLAALNSIMILRSLGSQERTDADLIMAKIEPYCVQHSNKALLSAYYIIKATSLPSGLTSEGHQQSIIKTKQYLQLALAPAQQTKDTHLLAIVMNTMTEMFFSGVVGGQAEKSANAGRTLARKTQDKLWLAVADGMYADILERAGNAAGGANALNEAANSLQALPNTVRKRLAEMPVSETMERS